MNTFVIGGFDLPIYRISKEDFSNIDWQAIKNHVHSKMEFVETEVFLFSSQVLGLKYKVGFAKNAIACQFWIDPNSFVSKHTHYRRKKWYSDNCQLCQRPILKNPMRFAYFSRYERKMISSFLQKIGISPWTNLQTIWISGGSKDGLIAVHLKVHDWEPFFIQI